MYTCEMHTDLSYVLLNFFSGETKLEVCCGTQLYIQVSEG
jgi:hypothetical protein